METQLFGNVDEPAVVVVSTWDPLLPAARGFLRQVVEYARAHGRNAVAVVLDPAPQRYLRGAANWAVYTSFHARVPYLLAEGLDGVLRVDFQQDDLTLGVYDLLDAVRTRIVIAEIWMRPRQTFGPDARGSAMAIAIYAKKHKIAWKRPATPDTRVLATTVQQHLLRGEIAAAQAIVGFPPIWSRPESEDFEVSWRPGHYVVTPGVPGDSGVDSVGYSDRIAVELREDADGLSYVRWPAREIEQLTVLSGPGDAALHAETLPRYAEHSVASMATE